MRWTRTHTVAVRLAALLAGGSAALTAGSAAATDSNWGCQGELGGQRILFDREALYVADGKPPAGRSGKVTAGTIIKALKDLKDAGGFTEFRADDVNGGLAESITFSRTGDDKQTQKAVFTERSSKLILHQPRVTCVRAAETSLYRNVYRYERDGEPPRDIRMYCMEYDATTRGWKNCR